MFRDKYDPINLFLEMYPVIMMTGLKIKNPKTK